AAPKFVAGGGVGAGRPGGDLFFRVHVVGLHNPPLREGPGDVAPLCPHLLDKLAPGRGAHLGPGEERLLAHYPWPGNVRELKNILERCLMLQDGADIHPSRLLEPFAFPAALPAACGDDAGEAELLPLDELERRHILRGLRACDGNLTRAAQALGISLSTLRRKLRDETAGASN